MSEANNMLSRQQVAESAVAKGVNVVVTGVRDDGKTIARVEPVRPQLQQTGGQPVPSQSLQQG